MGSCFRMVGYTVSERLLLAAVMVLVVLSGCGGRQPTNPASVGQLRLGMTFEQARCAAGAPREVIRRPRLLRDNPHSPFSRVWVYAELSPPREITYVYFDRAGRVVSIQRSRAGPAHF